MSDHSESKNPRTPECTDALAALPLYVGQDLDIAESDNVALHLDGCDSCSDEHERAQDARAVFAGGSWTTHESEGPSLWAGVRAGMVAEGLIGGRPRLVSGHGVSGHGVSAHGDSADTRSLVGRRVPGGRWWIGSGAAAAALFFAFGLSGLLGPLGSTGGGFTGSAVDVDGTRPTVSLEQRPAASDPRTPGHLRRPGADRSPLMQNAVEWLPEQGIYVPVTPPVKPSLVEGPRRLQPVQK